MWNICFAKSNHPRHMLCQYQMFISVQQVRTEREADREPRPHNDNDKSRPDIVAPVPRQAPLWSLVDVNSVNTYAAEMPIPNMPSKLNNITFSLRPQRDTYCTYYCFYACYTLINHAGHDTKQDIKALRHHN